MIIDPDTPSGKYEIPFTILIIIALASPIAFVFYITYQESQELKAEFKNGDCDTLKNVMINHRFFNDDLKDAFIEKYTWKCEK